jgi:hypothetical protein
MTKEERKEYNKKHYQANKDKIKNKSKQYREENKDKIKECNKEYYKKNKDKAKEYSKLNRNRINDRMKQYQKNRRKKDEIFKLICNTRNIICKSIKRKGFKKNTKTELILSCSYEEFKLHLESKFEYWMSWENYGLYNGELNYGWDIDHIIPLSSANTEQEIIELNHYTNLQPLCSYNNRFIKRDK